MDDESRYENVGGHFEIDVTYDLDLTGVFTKLVFGHYHPNKVMLNNGIHTRNRL